MAMSIVWLSAVQVVSSPCPLDVFGASCSVRAPAAPCMSCRICTRLASTRYAYPTSKVLSSKSSFKTLWACLLSSCYTLRIP